MSHHDYTVSRQIESANHPFYALIMAAMRKADDDNARKLQVAFPEVVKELHYRYWSVGGLMPDEEGYNPDGDDNLPVTIPVTDEPVCICGLPHLHSTFPAMNK